jgi:hypothetical protein
MKGAMDEKDTENYTVRTALKMCISTTQLQKMDFTISCGLEKVPE